MTTEPDPAEAIPTDNSIGAPIDGNLLDEAERSKADQAEADLQKTPGPAGGDPVINGLDTDG
jgi:hypothetical protein